MYKTRIKFKHKTFRAFTNGKCHPIIFYHLKKLLYQLYHTILQYIKHPKTLLFYHFIKILFLIFLYYFFPTVIFFFQIKQLFQRSHFQYHFIKIFFLIFFYHFFPKIIFFFSNSTNIPMVTFSIESLHPTTIIFSTYIDSHHVNSHIFNIYRFIYIYFQQPGFYFIFLRKNLPEINVLKLADFKNPHTYIFHQTCQISTYQLKKSTYIYIHATCQFLKSTYIIYMQPVKYQCT